MMHRILHALGPEEEEEYPEAPPTAKETNEAFPKVIDAFNFTAADI